MSRIAESPRRTASRRVEPSWIGGVRADRVVTGVGRGERQARDALAPVVYDELRRRAAAYLRRERPGHTLQPTALVHEAFVRLIGQRHMEWQGRAHFFAVAAQDDATGACGSRPGASRHEAGAIHPRRTGRPDRRIAFPIAKCSCSIRRSTTLRASIRGRRGWSNLDTSQGCPNRK